MHAARPWLCCTHATLLYSIVAGSVSHAPRSGITAARRHALQTVHDGRIYTLKIYCDESYPERPPRVQFATRINLSCVAPNGAVDPRTFPTLRDWNRSRTMETLLLDLRREMAQPHNRKLPQPPEGSSY